MKLKVVVRETVAREIVLSAQEMADIMRIPVQQVIDGYRGDVKIANSIDLKDLWKCHVMKNAQHLFIVIPMATERSQGSTERPFPSVCRRYATFFPSDPG